MLQQKKCEGLAVLTCSGVSMNGLARVIPFFLLIWWQRNVIHLHTYLWTYQLFTPAQFSSPRFAANCVFQRQRKRGREAESKVGWITFTATTVNLRHDQRNRGNRRAQRKIELLLTIDTAGTSESTGQCAIERRNFPRKWIFYFGYLAFVKLV